MNKLVPENFTLGVLGGGQLGLMLLPAAKELGIKIAILDPSPEAPCAHLADRFTVGSLVDHATVMDFGKSVDMLTIEIEHVNVDAMYDLSKSGQKVHPSSVLLRTIQNKSRQKEFYQRSRIPTAPFITYEQKPSFSEIEFPLPFVQKFATGGYDGRGVNIVRSQADWESIPQAPGLIESYIANGKEVSVIVARNASGEVKTFPSVEMEFHPTANLVEYLFSPSTLNPSQAEEAASIAVKTAQAFGLVGIMAVEMFLTPEGKILVNESAPRPHNSGHHTIEANHTSQYQQHLRAILDLELGDTGVKSPAVMVNLLGEPGHTGPARYEGREEVEALGGVFVHIYGKAETRPFRKMGHVTILGNTLEEARKKAIFVKKTLKVVT